MDRASCSERRDAGQVWDAGTRPPRNWGIDPANWVLAGPEKKGKYLSTGEGWGSASRFCVRRARGVWGAQWVAQRRPGGCWGLAARLELGDAATPPIATMVEVLRAGREEQSGLAAPASRPVEPVVRSEEGFHMTRLLFYL